MDIPTVQASRHILFYPSLGSNLDLVFFSISDFLPDFRFVRNDRSGNRIGGVAIYLKVNISLNVVDMSLQPPRQSPSHTSIYISHHHLYISYKSFAWRLLPSCLYKFYSFLDPVLSLSFLY